LVVQETMIKAGEGDVDVVQPSPGQTQAGRVEVPGDEDKDSATVAAVWEVYRPECEVTDYTGKQLINSHSLRLHFQLLLFIFSFFLTACPVLTLLNTEY